MPGPISTRADRLVNRLFPRRSPRSEQVEESEPTIKNVAGKYDELRKRRAPRAPQR